MVKYQKSLTSRILLCIGVTPIAVIVTITMIYGNEMCTKYFYIGVKPFMKLIKNFRRYFFNFSSHEVLVFESINLVNVRIKKIIAKYLDHNPTTTRRALEGRLIA